MRIFVQSHSGREQLDLPVSRILLAGYTGRNQESVRVHVAELAAHGIAAPARVPTVYAVPGTRICTAKSIDVHGPDTSGEAEFVMYRHGDRVLVGAASDHTDRGLEEYSIVKAKQCTEKPVGDIWWDLAELADHWDELRLHADALIDGEWRPYQDGSMAELLLPQDILSAVDRRVSPQHGDAVFSGTLPVIGGEFLAAEQFRAVLSDPVAGRALTCQYKVDVLPELDR